MLLLMGILLATAEHVVSFSVPSWPARTLRTIPIEALTVNVKDRFPRDDRISSLLNDRALRDHPVRAPGRRSLSRRAGR